MTGARACEVWFPPKRNVDNFLLKKFNKVRISFLVKKKYIVDSLVIEIQKCLYFP